MGWLSVRVVTATAFALAGCRFNFDVINDATNDATNDVTNTPTNDSGQPYARLADFEEPTSGFTTMTSTPTLTAESTVIVVLWGSSNTIGATAGDPVVGSYVADPTLTTNSTYAMQNVWIVDRHPGGTVPITLSWPMPEKPVLFVIEILGARHPAIDDVAVNEITVGPAFASPEVVTSASSDTLIAIDMTNTSLPISGEVVTFTSGESTLAATFDPVDFTGAVGIRRVTTAGRYHSTATHTVGTRCLFSLIAIAEP